MSSRTFTVFQDSPSREPIRAKVLRPNVLVKRTSPNIVTSATGSAMTADIDKENFDPLTGERAGPSNTTNKKRKTSVLATKLQSPTEVKRTKKDQTPPPEKKKRKPFNSASGDHKSGKKYTKSSGSSRKGIKRAGSKTLPRLTEEDEVSKMLLSTQEEIDSRCKDLTLKILADVSDAYDEPCVLDALSGIAKVATEAPDDILKPRLVVKAPSVEPEIRDYFEPSENHFAASTRIRAMSQGVPEPRSFSTPERKQIYTAFIFSSPIITSEIPTKKAENSRTPSPSRELA